MSDGPTYPTPEYDTSAPTPDFGRTIRIKLTSQRTIAHLRYSPIRPKLYPEVVHPDPKPVPEWTTTPKETP